jgi:transcriptional regulator with GAF, ATPase, and Fis domain
MRRHVELALQATGGRIEGMRGAARRLGINPHTLRARMKKLGVVWTEFRGQDTRRVGDAEPAASINQAMAAHITRTLQLTGGRVEGPYGAARRLAINPHTLRARMRKLGIVASAYRAQADAAGAPPIGSTPR